MKKLFVVNQGNQLNLSNYHYDKTFLRNLVPSFTIFFILSSYFMINSCKCEQKVYSKQLQTTVFSFHQTKLFCLNYNVLNTFCPSILNLCLFRLDLPTLIYISKLFPILEALEFYQLKTCFCKFWVLIFCKLHLYGQMLGKWSISKRLLKSLHIERRTGVKITLRI